MEENHSPYSFKSDRKLMGIVRLIYEEDIHQVTKIAKELNIAKSTVHTHLNTLRDYGFISKENGEYYLGLRFLEYGAYVQNHQQLYRAGKNKVDELAEETGEKIWIVVEEEGKAVYLYEAAGRNAIKTDESIGDRKPLLNLASGKAILAYLPKQKTETILQTEDLEGYAQGSVTDIQQELEVVRDKGVAYNIEEAIDDVNAIAAPICRDEGGVYGAISIGGPANRLTRSYLEENYADLMRGLSNELEINIRYMDK